MSYFPGRKIIMKFRLAYLFVSLFLLNSCDEIPRALSDLMSKSSEVNEYQKFEEINPVIPLPAKLELGAGAILSMAFLGKKSIDYSIVPPNQYNLLENRINVFFEHPGLQRSLRLLSYARQLKSEHPYRINPFVPYMSIRDENSLLSNQKVGPAAVVNELFKQKGQYVGTLKMKDDEGNPHKLDVKISAKNLPRSGIMFLFDHEMFSMNDLIREPEKNILQDVIVHEFTHIWHNEIISETARERHNVGSNSTENGHDTMIVSNPNLAFGEGLAEGFEALYGTSASQSINMSARERDEFFGRFSNRVKEEIEFLVNRQGHVRRNSYLYNLYDFKDCTLRVVSTMDAANVNSRGESASDLARRISRGENIDVSTILSSFDWDNFSDRFYRNSQRTSTIDLAKNCKIDPWQRLESKEGFVATLIYNLLYSGALVDSQFIAERTGLNDKNKKIHLKKYDQFFTALNNDWKKWAKATLIGRNIANDDRKVLIEKIFLLGYRNLVKSIIHSDAITIGNLTRYLLSEQSHFDDQQKIRIAYQIMKVSKGAFMNQESDSSKTFAQYFTNPQTIQNNLDKIELSLNEMMQNRELSKVVEKLDRTPRVMVSYLSRLSGKGKKRINLNTAYHIDLIDMFGTNSPKIKQLADRLDQGLVFQSEEEFLKYAENMGMHSKARVMLNEAQAELIENQKALVDQYRGSVLLNHSFSKRIQK